MEYKLGHAKLVQSLSNTTLIAHNYVTMQQSGFPKQNNYVCFLCYHPQSPSPLYSRYRNTKV